MNLKSKMKSVGMMIYLFVTILIAVIIKMFYSATIVDVFYIVVVIFYMYKYIKLKTTL